MYKVPVNTLKETEQREAEAVDVQKEMRKTDLWPNVHIL